MTSEHPADGPSESERETTPAARHAERERVHEKLRHDLIALDLEFDLVTTRLEEAIDGFEKAEVTLRGEIARLEGALERAEAERDAALEQATKP